MLLKQVSSATLLEVHTVNRKMSITAVDTPVVDTETPQHKLALGSKTEVTKWLAGTGGLELSVAIKL